MSYCVNCGVELDASARECPLCNTPVVNPREQMLQKGQGSPGGADKTPFPKEKGQVETVKRKDLGILLSMVVLASAATCGILNLFVFQGVPWSLAVIGAGVILWVFMIPAVIYTRQSIYVSLLLDGAAVVLTICVILDIAVITMLSRRRLRNEVRRRLHF